MGAKGTLKKAVRYTLSNIGHPVRVEFSLAAPSGLLSGRCVLVTGGTSGIGSAVAEAILRQGGDVVVTSRDKGRAEAAADKLNADGSSGRAFGVAIDLGDAEGLSRQVDAAYAAAPRAIDALVNNAGVLKGAPFGQTSVEDFDEVVEINLRGTYFLTQEVAHHMVAGKVQGNICFITSSSAYRPATNVYSCAKWALRGFVEGTAKMLSPYGIVVNAVAPGPTATGMLIEGDTSNVMKPNSPIGRYVTPEEIASMVVTLLSDSSRSTVGDTVRMCGGSGVVTYDDVDATFEI